eukprot:SAG31_NODE_46464_length_254_cov_0.929032_1_plen_30_part_10
MIQIDLPAEAVLQVTSTVLLQVAEIFKIVF